MDERFERCIKEGKLYLQKIQPDLVKKEIESAEEDMKAAENSLEQNMFKWATVQAYYTIFHSAKALVLNKGYVEKSHSCLFIALKTMYVDTGILEKTHLNRFRDCMNLREDADYGAIYSEKSSKIAVSWAKEMLEVSRKLIK